MWEFQRRRSHKIVLLGSFLRVPSSKSLMSNTRMYNHEAPNFKPPVRTPSPATPAQSSPPPFQKPFAHVVDSARAFCVGESRSFGMGLGFLGFRVEPFC